MSDFASYDRTAPPPVNLSSQQPLSSQPLSSQPYGTTGSTLDSRHGSSLDPLNNSYKTSNNPFDTTNAGVSSGVSSNLHSNTNSGVNSNSKTANAQNGLNNAKNAVVNNASAAADAVKNHPVTQSITNGPVVENVLDQHAKTTNELSNLAASRTRPSQTAATGQQLTHYHSFFSTLLSWEHPRASAIAYASVVGFIFAARYFNILRYGFKLTWVTLGVTILAEILGKTLLSNGLTSQFRPRRYYTVPKTTLDSYIGDVHELINFFVIEAQRIVFAENVYVSGAAFLGAFLSYYLIKIVPFWGLSLIGTSVLFLGPLIYKTNKTMIDHHINKAADIANQQSTQVKNLASQHAARATETTKQYVGDYSAKASEMIGNVRQRSTSPTTTSTKPAQPSSLLNDSRTDRYKSGDFPAAPQSGLKTDSAAYPVAPSSDFAPRIPSGQFAASGGAAPVSGLHDPAYPVAPTSNFASGVPTTHGAPSVGASANALRPEHDPLYSS